MKKISHNRKKTPIRESFGRKVKIQRIREGLNQIQLAKIAHLSPGYIGQVERGERNIGLENIISLFIALNLSCKDLLDEL